MSDCERDDAKNMKVWSNTQKSAPIIGQYAPIMQTQFGVGEESGYKSCLVSETNAKEK